MCDTKRIFQNWSQEKDFLLMLNAFLIFNLLILKDKEKPSKTNKFGIYWHRMAVDCVIAFISYLDKCRYSWNLRLSAPLRLGF